MKLSIRSLAGLLVVGLLATACGAGTLDSAEVSSSAAPPASASASATGPTVVVTVPDLLPAGSPGSADAASTPASASRTSSAEAVDRAVVPTPAESATSAAAPTEPSSVDPDRATTAAVSTAPAAPAETTAAPATSSAPAGEGLNVSLANCEGCTVLATHRDVTGDLSAALVETGARAILLSVAADGETRGVIGVPYGAAFSTPDGAVLACAAGTCVVQAFQPDGRAILSAFELTDTGAWRDVSGDDALPSATENGAVIDAGDRLAIAVQDQADGAAVWVLYTWDGTRYSVVGCSADGPVPASTDAVSSAACLS